MRSAIPFVEVRMRADAKKNYAHLVEVARAVVLEQGAEASLRDVARRAGVGYATLYRHFPTRDALLEVLLREGFDELAAKAAALETATDTGDALISWLREVVSLAHDYRGAIALMTAAIEDPASALHDSCVKMKAAGARLLVRAQASGAARADVDGADLFAVVGSLAWISDQPSLASRAGHLFGVIAGAFLTSSKPRARG